MVLLNNLFQSFAYDDYFDTKHTAFWSVKKRFQDSAENLPDLDWEKQIRIFQG